MSRQYGSGHSRALRAKLRAERMARGLTQEQVGEAVAKRLGLPKPVSDSTISAWESFERHPGIDAFAAWHAVLGLRLLVDSDSADSVRIPVLLNPRTVELARAIDAADEKDLEWIEATLERVLGVKSRS